MKFVWSNSLLLLLLGITFILPTGCKSESEYNKQINVLFIGNSYTAPLPPVIKEISRANGVDVNIKSISPGGWTLKKHAGSEITLSAIRQNVWDFVVLQEQSQLPSFSDAQRQEEVLPYAEKICTEIFLSGATPLLYLTWGRKNGDIRNVPNDTRSLMQERLTAGYQDIADLCEASIVPVGQVWESLSSSSDAINLYAQDGSHPNEEGIFLASLVFSRYFKGEPLVVSSKFDSLPEEIVLRLTKITNKASLD
ncbi:hypothetical protein BTJ40_06090 [Microbulbifer sp. A4B17]|uniref:hypothetical protein n=1 Tax=Microbulbifer sp. A4B17 TaxID=359370 RepID=UPI000D52DB21|nr:hypothetical protein [Microbulbifer sp. A4B17]AWF80414.1 hypothetical protein BTJ40_06090 [Microbulbifer sp. A4B17]